MMAIEAEGLKGDKVRWTQCEQGCYAWNRRCEFWDACQQAPNELDDFLEGEYVIDPWNPKNLTTGGTK
jgi:hypothetical protein